MLANDVLLQDPSIGGGGGGGTVTNVTGTLPVVSSGGTTPAISLSGLTGFGSPGQAIMVDPTGTTLMYGAPWFTQGMFTNQTTCPQTL